MVDFSPRPTRLKDVAERAGVSTATVSRVLNGLGPTSEAVRTRVLQAAKELDYHPNWLARSLRARRTNTIGVVLPDIGNLFFSSLVKGVEQQASSHAWNVILCNTDEDPTKEEALVGTLVERKIDGLLLCPAAGPHAYLARHLERRLPVVAVNRRIPELSLPAVTNDNLQAAYEATRHLLTRGVRRLALIPGLPHLSTTEDRLAGCHRAAAEFGLATADLVVRPADGKMDEGYKAALECLEAHPRPQAIFAFNGPMTEAALMAIRARGLRCPEDVALIGFDDFRSAAALSPPLTMVEQHPIEMGKAALEELAQIIETGHPIRSLTLIPTRLVVRGSCGCGATAGARR
jgi:LacI family transcriptional regulator